MNNYINVFFGLLLGFITAVIVIGSIGLFAYFMYGAYIKGGLAWLLPLIYGGLWVWTIDQYRKS